MLQVTYTYRKIKLEAEHLLPLHFLTFTLQQTNNIFYQNKTNLKKKKSVAREKGLDKDHSGQKPRYVLPGSQGQASFLSLALATWQGNAVDSSIPVTCLLCKDPS